MKTLAFDVETLEVRLIDEGLVYTITQTEAMFGLQFFLTAKITERIHVSVDTYQ